MKCSIVYPGQFYVWITCMLAEYEDAIIAGMVKKGYHVSTAAADGQVTLFNKDNPSALICIKVESKNEEITASEISDDVRNFLSEKKFLYYSVIVSACTSCCWSSTNIVLPPKPSVAPPPIPSSDKSNLN